MLTARCKFLISSVLLIKVSVSPAGCASLHTSSSTSTNCMSEFLFTIACVCTSVRYNTYNPPPISSFSFTVQSLQEAVCCQHGSAKSAQFLHNSVICDLLQCRSCLDRTLQWSPLPAADKTLDTGHQAPDTAKQMS